MISKIINKLYIICQVYRNCLTHGPVDICECGSFDSQVSRANFEDGFVVDHESTVGVLEGRVGSQNRVVRLDDGRGHLWRWVDGEFEFGFLAVVDAQTLHDE